MINPKKINMLVLYRKDINLNFWIMAEKQSYMDFMKELTAVVLAGGKSRRFGSSKSSARFDNKNLIDIALELAFKICNRIIVIHGNEKVPLPKNIKSYPDIYYSKGPLGGIHGALFFSETKYVVVLPVDMPLLSPAIYKHLISNIKKDKPVAAISKKGLEPLVSIWSRQNIPMIEQFIKEDKLSIWSCMEQLSAVRIDFTELYPEIPDDCFYNINTKEDLELLKKSRNDAKMNDHIE